MAGRFGGVFDRCRRGIAVLCRLQSRAQAQFYKLLPRCRCIVTWANRPSFHLIAVTKMPHPLHDTSIFHHAKFDLQALLRLAARLRNRPCTCNLSQKPLSGSFNWAINLVFDDGVQWIFRSPRTHYGLNEETVGNLLASEAATLKFIKENSSIPVPEVFSYRSISFFPPPHPSLAFIY